GLKLWNTSISTAATTTQSSRFFTRSFIWQGRSLWAGQLVLGEGVDLGRAPARGGRLADGHFRIPAPQFPQVVVEPGALEQLDQEGPARSQVVVGEVHGQLRQVH